ncbi:MAG: HD domain-containing phosphohydrolase [Actinomycetota bacterium]
MAGAAVTERLARRLIPLSVLLELSMLFPEGAPSRWTVARRARLAKTSPSQLLDSRDEDAAGAAVRILALMSALAAHDRRTRGHAERVRALSDLLAIRMDLPRADRDKLRWAALLHDVGKLRVKATVLNKPGRLDKSEWATIKRHPADGERLCGSLLPWLGEWGKAIGEHHERFDGTGYPLGLSGTGIGRAGRIVGVVDAYETMTAARPYKKAFATRDARAELARCAGTQFDAGIVRAFLAIPLPRLLWAAGPVSFAVQVPFLRVIEGAGLRVASISSSVAATTTAVAGAAVIALPVVAASVALPAARPTVATQPTATYQPASPSGTGFAPSVPRAASGSGQRPAADRKPPAHPAAVVHPTGSAVATRPAAPAPGAPAVKASPGAATSPAVTPSTGATATAPAASAVTPSPTPQPAASASTGGTATAAATDRPTPTPQPSSSAAPQQSKTATPTSTWSSSGSASQTNSSGGDSGQPAALIPSRPTLPTPAVTPTLSTPTLPALSTPPALPLTGPADVTASNVVIGQAQITGKR